MANREKAYQLVKIFLRNTEIGKKNDIDLNDLNLYISYAVENELINESEIHINRKVKT